MFEISNSVAGARAFSAPRPTNLGLERGAGTKARVGIRDRRAARVDGAAPEVLAREFGVAQTPPFRHRVWCTRCHSRNKLVTAVGEG